MFANVFLPGVPLPQRLLRYARLARLDKPIGIYLLLWPTLDALWLAEAGWPGLRRILIFALGTLLTRSAGCVVNDMADRRFDGHVDRTAGRVLAQGLVSVGEAGLLAFTLTLLAALCLPFLDRAVWPLAVIAVLLSVSYPFFKRFFPLPQAWLGLAFSFGIPMAYADCWGVVPFWAWWFFIANLFWVIAYDTEYAMVDRPDDLRIGIRSSAIFFGRADVSAVAICYGVYLGMFAIMGRVLGLGWGFDLAWVLAAAMAIRHLVWIRHREPAPCLRAFKDNHWLGLCLLAGVIAGQHTVVWLRWP